MVLSIGGIILIIVIVGFIYYKMNEKKKFVEDVNKLEEDVKSHLNSYIEKWDEEKLIFISEKYQIIIEKRKYSFDEAVKFTTYKNQLPGVIYKNNLKVLERLIMDYLSMFNDMLSNGKEFIITQDIKLYSEQFKQETKDYADKSIKYDSRIIQDFMNIYDNPEAYLTDLNSQYLQNEKDSCSTMFNNIDGKSLDNNQRNAVVNDDLRQLVVAGAGSGKTLTMSAKVKYLVERKGINPKDILLISFTRKAADEMGERIRRLGIDVESSTFHKYGLSVIRNINQKTPDVAEDISKYIDEYLSNIVYNDDKLAKEFLILLGTLMLPVFDGYETIGERITAEQRQDLTTIKGMYEAYSNKKKSDKLEEEIENLEIKLGPLHDKLENISEEQSEETINETIYLIEKQIYQLKAKKRTIRNEQLKSAEEVMLANLFFLDGVEYSYETEYPFDENNNFRKKYRPDFYLPKSNVYWEHFGIDEDGRARQYAVAVEKEYLDGIKWKRNIHKENKTILAETYSWQFRKNKIADAVNKNYIQFGIEKQEVRYCDIIKEILKGDAIGNIESFKALLSTFIVLFKSYGYSVSKFDELKILIKNYKDSQLSETSLERRMTRDEMFVTFAEGFFCFYNEMLIEEHKIDFNDMIIQATALIEQGTYIPSYNYVIIDEYQDISVGRYNLAKATLEHSNAKLFCVGDDWQSIYRFTGSEVDLLVNFEKYFGTFSRTDITQTYRNSQELLDLSGAFVQSNSYQTPKELKSDKHIDNPIKVAWYTGKDNPILENENAEFNISFAHAFCGVVKEIVKEKRDGDILVLGRNNSDIKELALDNNITVAQIEGETRIILAGYPKLQMRFLTVHRSKGLEADNVIILNMRNGRSGFPNQIVDDPILNLLRNSSETFPFAEERRLFYVAITRTRNRVYLLAPITKSSRFLDDISKIHKNVGRSKIVDIYPEVGETTINSEKPKPLSCPLCKVGTLVKRKGADGKTFVSCSNYPICTYHTSKLADVRKNNRCPVCDNFLTKRNGRNGEFLGCMSYPYCTYSANLTIETVSEEFEKQKQKERVGKYANRFTNNTINKESMNTHTGWTIEEDYQLIDEFKAKKSILEIIRIHQRSNSAIIARLQKLGLMD